MNFESLLNRIKNFDFEADDAIGGNGMESLLDDVGDTFGFESNEFKKACRASGKASNEYYSNLGEDDE